MNVLLRRSAARHSAPMLACWLLSLSAVTTVVGQDKKDLLNFIPDDSIVAATGYPRAVLLQPDMELLPREVFTAAGQKELGIDPMTIEQFVVFAQTPAQFAGPPGYGAAIRFSQPYQREGLLPMLLENSELTTLNNRPLYRAQAPFQPSVLLYDDTTLVIAPELVLPAMLAERANRPPLADLLRAAKGQYHVSAVAHLDPVREMLNAALGAIPPPPPQFEKFLEIPQLVSKLELHVNYGGAIGSRLAAHSHNAAAARKLEALLIEGISIGKDMLLAAVAAEQQGDDPIELAMLRYMERLTNHFAEMLKPKREDDKVAITIKSDSTVATTGVLVALLLPAVQSAREAARRMQSANNLKQIGLAMHNYHDTYNTFPASASYDADGKPLLSWRVHLLPFLGESQLYDQFHLDEPWDSEHNRRLVERIPDVFRCANNPAAAEGFTNYVVPIGKDTVFGEKRGIGIRSILDGTSNTILAIEANNDSAVIWTKPEDLEFDVDDPFAGLFGLRVGGFQVGLCDGSVQFISETVDRNVLRALMTKAGGEVIPNF